MRWSIRTRLTLWCSALLVTTLTAFGGGVLWLHTRWVRAQFDSELAGLGAATTRTMEEELRESGVLRKAAHEAASSMDVPGRATAILDESGLFLAGQWHGFRYDRMSLPIDTARATQFVTVDEGDGGAWRVFTRYESSPAGDYVILIAGPLDQVLRQQHLLTRVLLVATPLVVLIGAGLSWWAASSALRPVTSMAAEAEAITAQSADWRLHPHNTNDELGQLTRAFNRLLDRLRDALRTQREFMADASHELRTPVSVIQTAAEVTLDRPSREEAEYRDALTIVCEQSARLSHVVDDMLVLARADAAGYPVARRPLDVDDVVEQCVRSASIVAVTKNIRLVTELQSDVTIDADDRLLRRLVTNLLDNALQHTPPGGVVTVGVSKHDEFATITVEDTGPGIPAADRERVFERFVRLDPARSATTGAGLGLSIARWIAERHQGTLSVEPGRAGGCRFSARLPMTSHSAADDRSDRSSNERWRDRVSPVGPRT